MTKSDPGYATRTTRHGTGFDALPRKSETAFAPNRPSIGPSPGRMSRAYFAQPNIGAITSDVESQAWLRQGRPKPASIDFNSEKWS
jgi:hypothetical protein